MSGRPHYTPRQEHIRLLLVFVGFLLTVFLMLGLTAKALLNGEGSGTCNGLCTSGEVRP